MLSGEPSDGGLCRPRFCNRSGKWPPEIHKRAATLGDPADYTLHKNALVHEEQAWSPLSGDLPCKDGLDGPPRQEAS